MHRRRRVAGGTPGLSWCAAIDTALRALLPATVLAGLASALRVVLPDDRGSGRPPMALSLLFLLLAAFAAQLEVNLRQSPVREQLMSTLMLMLAFFVGGAVVARQLVDSATITPGPACQRDACRTHRWRTGLFWRAGAGVAAALLYSA